MSGNSWYQVLVSQQGAGPALSNSTTATSLLPGQAKWVLAANWFEAAGKKLRVKAHGKISTAAATPGTFTIDHRFGATVVFNGGASPTLATSASNVTFDYEADLVIQSVGSGTTATLLGVGKFVSAAFSATTPIILVPASSPAAGSGFDSTVSFAIDMFGTWSVASASNSITVTDYELASLN